MSKDTVIPRARIGLVEVIDKGAKCRLSITTASGTETIEVTTENVAHLYGSMIGEQMMQSWDMIKKLFKQPPET